MCGIVGYVGSKQASPILIDGLKRLEYRGYDSAGVAVYRGDGTDAPSVPNSKTKPTVNGGNGKLQIERCKGKLANLIAKVEKSPLYGTLGLGHTRWATHGSPSEMNAHPHWSDKVVVVHNGIIENYLELKEMLLKAGAKFTSQTDTEVIPHLVEYYWGKLGDWEAAFRESINSLVGSYSVGMFAKQDHQTIYAAKYRNPLILGLGHGENYLASDIPAILNYTRDIVILEDGDIAIITPEATRITDLKGKTIKRAKKEITWTTAMAEKEGYRHFMLKEIHEQPKSVTQTIQGRVNQDNRTLTLDDTNLPISLIKNLKRIVIIACGTSWHAALTGKYLFEALAKIPVEVDLASEFRYRQPILGENALLLAISQSGETADTLAALDEAKAQKTPILSICNVLDASIPRASSYTFYTHAGPEIGVASTKAFTTQLTGLYMLALHFAEMRGTLSKAEVARYIQDLIHLPSLMEDQLAQEKSIIELSKKFFKHADFLYLGRGLSFPIALEGALKLKEISYIHAEGYAAGEIKHGPIALIDENMPVMVIAPGDHSFEKILSNLSEVKTRGGITILCISEKQRQQAAKMTTAADHLITTPSTNPFLLPVLQTIPLQLLAYHIAVLRGTDVDQPRNLAKSVTVE